MAHPQVQPLICPHSIRVEVSSLVDDTDHATETPLAWPCAGPQCRFWQFDPATGPQSGECADVITARSTNALIHIGMQLLEEFKAFLGGEELPGTPANGNGVSHVQGEGDAPGKSG